MHMFKVYRTQNGRVPLKKLSDVMSPNWMEFSWIDCPYELDAHSSNTDSNETKTMTMH